MLRIAVLLLAVVSSLLLSCQTPCGPANCSGCCDPSGVCGACSKPAVQCLPSTCADCGDCDKPKPNLMVVLDKSGSMNFAADPTVVGCEVCANSPCFAPCSRTRMTDLRQAMSAFLTGPAATVARMGLLPFPANQTCGPATGVQIATTGVELNPTLDPSAAELQAAAEAVNAKIAIVTPGGGTPTGATLRALASYTPLLGSDRHQFVLLITDGLPNCNDALNLSTCACTAPGMSPCGGVASNQCLDKADTVAAVTELRALGIRTFVVGFGAEAAAGSGTAADVLNAMALAGGVERKCPNGTDAECDGPAGSCQQATKTCSTAYYRAADGAGLSAALVKIAACLTP